MVRVCLRLVVIGVFADFNAVRGQLMDRDLTDWSISAASCLSRESAFGFPTKAMASLMGDMRIDSAIGMHSSGRAHASFRFLLAAPSRIFALLLAIYFFSLK
jgi:hypothetical protein